MAHQDYVSRARTPKKKSNPYQPKQAEVAVGIPLKTKLIAVVLLIALAAFAYFLWSIKDIETPSVAEQVEQAQQEENASQLPTPPKEKWQYMEQLKSKEVEVGEYAVVEKGPYKMQCGSFRTRKQAEVMKAKIAFSGLSAQISAAKGSSGTWHKVYLGPYEKKRNAEKDKHKLNSNNISTCQIWLWK